ncbi:MAG TPA: serine hydrolase [Vicinamibacterales bacterium]|nr:serine hydrolase [Vicinamibacterales bacterium]
MLIGSVHAIAFALAAATMQTGPARPDPALDSLGARIQARIAAVPGAVVGVAFRDLAGTDELFLNADESFHAASTMKVAVMIETFRQIDAGHLRPEQGILLVNQFGSIVDGTPYSLDPADDSDSSLYARVGERVPVRELIDRMITRSSNLATNAVIALIGAANANATAHRLGATRMQVLRGVEDSKAYEAGRNNTTTARDLAALLTALERGEAASRASTDSMRSILLRQEFNDRIPAGLPEGTRVAHKTGEITAVAHDAAIVYPPGRGPYVLVVLTRGLRDRTTSASLAANISRVVYEHVTRPAVRTQPRGL